VWPAPTNEFETPDLDRQIDKQINTMQTQIKTLRHIPNKFSEFYWANLPKNPEKPTPNLIQF